MLQLLSEDKVMLVMFVMLCVSVPAAAAYVIRVLHTYRKYYK